MSLLSFERSNSCIVAGVALATMLAFAPRLAAAQSEPQPTGPTPQLVDRIVAIVDEEPILLSDLEREIETYQFERQAANLPEEEDALTIRQEMLDRLVEIKLLVAQAKVDGLVIGDDELEAAVGEEMQRLVDRFGTRTALDRELAKAGMSYDDLLTRNRELTRNRMYTSRMVQTYVRPRVEVREDEVRAFYEEKKEELPSKPTVVELANILVIPQPDEAALASLNERLSAIREALNAGTSFEDVAREFSDGPNAQRGGGLGSFGRGDLFSAILDEAAWSLPVGQISEPISTEIGMHVIEVTERTDTEVTLRQILVRVDIGDEERALAKTRAAQVAQLARSGQDFAALARDYSDDPGTREQGGKLGAFEEERLSPLFAGAIETLEAGEVSDPVESPTGYFILKVLDRQPGEVYSFEEVEGRVRELLYQQKTEEELDTFLEELRERFYIEIKA